MVELPSGQTVEFGWDMKHLEEMEMSAAYLEKLRSPAVSLVVDEGSLRRRSRRILGRGVGAAPPYRSHLVDVD
jgi:hypothetical protein